MQSSLQTVNLQKAASATSTELKSLSEKLQLIQAVISDVMTDENTRATKNIMDLQSLDYIQQSLEAMDGFWRAVADKIPAGLTIDAPELIDAIKIQDLSVKFAGQTEIPSIISKENVGICDFF